MFGLKESEVSELIRSVSPEETRDGLDRAGIEERFARSAWSGIAEPGDRVAGLLIAEVGAPSALAALIQNQSAHSLTSGFDPGSVAEKDLQLALDRWRPRLASATALTALRQASRLGVMLCVPGDKEWLSGADDLEQHAPLTLWLRGDVAGLPALEKSDWHPAEYVYALFA